MMKPERDDYFSPLRPWWLRMALSNANAAGCDFTSRTIELVVVSQSGATALG